MTGNAIPAHDLRAGLVIHIEPHQVYGRMIGHRVTDVLITDVRDEGSVTVIKHCGCRNLIGADPAECGATVYEADDLVVVIGGVAA